MMTLCVRRVTAFTQSLGDAFAHLMPQLSPRLAVPSAERLRAIVETPSAALFVAEAEGRIVGMLTLVWYDVPSGRKAWIEDVVVDAAARGLGAGEKLVRAAQQHASKIGAAQVMLTSSPAREAARRLYRRVGFGEAGTSVFVWRP